jgi:hypothetical protein
MTFETLLQDQVSKLLAPENSIRRQPVLVMQPSMPMNFTFPQTPDFENPLMSIQNYQGFGMFNFGFLDGSHSTLPNAMNYEPSTEVVLGVD